MLQTKALLVICLLARILEREDLKSLFFLKKKLMVVSKVLPVRRVIQAFQLTTGVKFVEVHFVFSALKNGEPLGTGLIVANVSMMRYLMMVLKLGKMKLLLRIQELFWKKEWFKVVKKMKVEK